MESEISLVESSCRSHFIKLEFDRHGEVIDSSLLYESNDNLDVLEMLPENYRQIAAIVHKKQSANYNVRTTFQNYTWQWAFHFQDRNVHAYAIDISYAVRKETILSQHRDQVAKLRLQESILSFRRLAHDFRSPVSAMISGLSILVPALSIDESSDEKVLIDEMSKECNGLYETIGDKINIQLFEQVKNIVNKSLVDIKTLLITTEKYSYLMRDYFDIDYIFSPMKKVPDFYCDLEKLTLALYEMLLFLAQEYTDSTVEINVFCIENQLQFSFYIKEQLCNQQHKELIEKYFKPPSNVEVLLQNRILKICELISLNEGVIKIENYSVDNNSEACCWLFVFELN